MKYASTDKLTSKADVQLQREPSRLVMLKAYAPFFVIVAVYSFVMVEPQDLLPAYLRTKISCATPVPTNGACPIGSFYAGGQCKPTPHLDPNWSGSAACMDKMYVVDESVRFTGNMGTLGSACQLIALIFLGTTMLDVLGRKPALILSSTGLGVGTIVMTVSCWIVGTRGLNLMLLSVFCSSIVDCFLPACWAMASDIGGDDLTKRGIILGLVQMIRSAGIVISFAIGYPILSRDATDYSWVFVAIAIVSVVLVLLIVLILRETAPATLSSEQQPLKQANLTSGASEAPPASGVRKVMWVLGKGAQEMWAALCVNWSDGYLFWQLFVSFASNIALGGMFTISIMFSVGVVGLKQQTASLQGVLAPAMAICGAAASTLLTKTVGPFVATWMGFGTNALGCFLAGLTAALPMGQQQPVWWISCVFNGIGIGIHEPTSIACMSSRAETSMHGKIFAAQLAVGAVGGLVGAQVWPKNLFNVSPELTWQRGAPYYFTAAILCICIVIQVFQYVVYVRHTSRDKAESADTESVLPVH